MKTYCKVRIVELDLTVDEYTFPTKKKFDQFIYWMNSNDYCTGQPKRSVENGVQILTISARLW